MWRYVHNIISVISCHVCPSLAISPTPSADACANGYVQLVNDASDLERFLIKDTLSSGRVEICITGTFRSICEDNWSNGDSSVLCGELGFSRYG